MSFYYERVKSILDDPSETRDLSAEYPHIVTYLLDVLQKEKTRISEPVLSRNHPAYSYSEVTDSNGILKPGYCDPKDGHSPVKTEL